MSDRPEPKDHQSKIPTTPAREVAVAMLRTEGFTISCSCGWTSVHDRAKVRDSAAQRHLDKRHEGQGLWF